MSKPQLPTPGPWSYEPAPHAEGQEPFAFCVSGEKYFADVHVLTTDADTSRAEADARLIAAAPDMLAALELFANLPAEAPPPGVMRATWEAAISALVAAIAKARGA